MQVFRETLHWKDNYLIGHKQLPTIRIAAVVSAATPTAHFMCKLHFEKKITVPGKQSQALNDCATYQSLQSWFVFSLWQQEHSKAIYSLGTSTCTNHFQEAVCIQSLLLWRQREPSSMDTNQSLLHSLSAVSAYIGFISGCPTPGAVHSQVRWGFELLDQVVSVPALGSGAGTRSSSKSFPTQAILWFYDLTDQDGI